MGRSLYRPPMLFFGRFHPYERVTTMSIMRAKATVLLTALAAASLAAQSGPAGGSQGHENVQPFTCVTFIIALEGIFPSRN